MKTLREVIAKNIRSFRVDMGWSQADLARWSGLTNAAICQIENNKRTPSLESVWVISQALKVSIDELVRVK